MTEESIEHMAGVVETKGTDAFWQLPIEELLPDALRTEAPRWVQTADLQHIMCLSLGLSTPCSLATHGHHSRCPGCQHWGHSGSGLLGLLVVDGEVRQNHHP